MTTRRTRLVVAGLAALSLTAVAVPAHAADPTATTDVTFTLTAGELAIAAPAAANFGTVGASTTLSQISGKLGATTVTDTRGGLASVHTVTLTATDFKTGGGSANETILGATVTGMSGPVAHTNPGGLPLETLAGVPAVGTPIAGLSAYIGNDVATYNPTVTIPIPATNVAGVYTGKITQTLLAV